MLGGPAQRMSGGVLLSHNLSVAVPSALKGLTSGFGMGPGVSRFAMAAVTLSTLSNQLPPYTRWCCVCGVGLLVGNCVVDANMLAPGCVRVCSLGARAYINRVCGCVRGWDKPSAY